MLFFFVFNRKTNVNVCLFLLPKNTVTQQIVWLIAIVAMIKSILVDDAPFLFFFWMHYNVCGKWIDLDVAQVNLLGE